MRFGGRQKLTLAQQLVNLRANPICAGKGAIVQGRLEWRCDLWPTPLSRIYSVRIQYRLSYPPNVFVDWPDLRILAGGRKIPHVYSEKLHFIYVFICLGRANGAHGCAWIEQLSLGP
jgi:hypothetical protein